VRSSVHEVSFVRAHPSQPAAILGFRYDDRAGLLAAGVDLDADPRDEVELRRTATPFPLSTGRYAQPPRGWSGR
jgi:hypothetical protein